MIVTTYSYRAGARLTLLPSTPVWMFGLQVDESEVDTDPAPAPPIEDDE
jgi:hypothetical protein